MAMARETERSSQSGSTSQSQKAQFADTSVYGLDAKSIKSILLPSGWVSVRDAELVFGAIGTAHSPVSPTKLYPTLKHFDAQGNELFTPVRQILSYSMAQISGNGQNR